MCTRNREPEKPENPEPEPELEILESVNNELASGSGECFDSSPKVRKNKASPNHIESCPTVTGITEEILESRCEELNLESVSTLRNRTAVEEIRTVLNIEGIICEREGEQPCHHAWRRWGGPFQRGG